MADRGELRVADAQTTTARAQDRVVAKPYFYNAGRILGRVARLYGYSMLLSGISSLFLSGFSSLPLTKWDGKEGVPRADVVLVSVLLKLWISAGVSCLSKAVRDDPICACQYRRGTNANSRRAKPLATTLFHVPKGIVCVRVQHLDSRSVHRPSPTVLLPAVRMVGNVCRKRDWIYLKHLHLHRSPSRPRSQPEVFHAGRVSSVV